MILRSSRNCQDLRRGSSHGGRSCRKSFGQRWHQVAISTHFTKSNRTAGLVVGGRLKWSPLHRGVRTWTIDAGASSRRRLEWRRTTERFAGGRAIARLNLRRLGLTHFVHDFRERDQDRPEQECAEDRRDDESQAPRSRASEGESRKPVHGPGRPALRTLQLTGTEEVTTATARDRGRSRQLSDLQPGNCEPSHDGEQKQTDDWANHWTSRIRA